MPSITELKEKRASTFEQVKALVDRADKEEREFSAEEQETYDRMNSEMDEDQLTISKMEKEERITALRASLDKGPGEKAVGQRTRNEQFIDEARALFGGQSRSLEVKFTAEDVADIDNRHAQSKEQRVLLGLSGTGANVVPISFVRRLREHLVEHAAIRQTNVTVLVTEGGEALRVPKTTTHPSAALIGENASITASDPVFAQVTLDAYKYANLQQLSSEFVQDEVVNVLEYLARQNGLAIGDASGAHMVTGTGSGQPNGVVTAAIAAGTNIVTGTTGQTTTVIGDNLIDLFHKPASGYRRNAFWLMRDASVAAVRKIKDTTNQYLWQPGLQAGQPDLLLGKPVVADPNVAAMAANAYSIAFGDFSCYYIRDAGSVRIERSDDFAFSTDLVTFRAVLRTDGDLIDSNGIALYRNSAT
jgi:HK97 family phage major capsid protein